MGILAFAVVSCLRLPLKCPATLLALISMLAGHLTSPRRNTFELGSSGFTCILAHLFVNPFANRNGLRNSFQPVRQECK